MAARGIVLVSTTRPAGHVVPPAWIGEAGPGRRHPDSVPHHGSVTAPVTSGPRGADQDRPEPGAEQAVGHRALGSPGHRARSGAGIAGAGHGGLAAGLGDLRGDGGGATVAGLADVTVGRTVGPGVVAAAVGPAPPRTGGAVVLRAKVTVAVVRPLSP